LKRINEGRLTDNKTDFEQTLLFLIQRSLSEYLVFTGFGIQAEDAEIRTDIEAIVAGGEVQ